MLSAESVDLFCTYKQNYFDRDPRISRLGTWFI